LHTRMPCNKLTKLRTKRDTSTMKLSWKVASLAALSCVVTEGRGAFQSTNFHSRPSPSLDMVRRARRRSMMPSTRSLLAPSQIFREMDQMLEESFSSFDDFFEFPLTLRNSSPFTLERANRASDFAFVRRPRPTYKLTQDGDKVELVVSFPGAKAEDIEADIEQNGRVIRLRGVSKMDEDGMSIECRFEKAFVLGRPGEKFDEDNITAKMSDGVLTIIAPKIAEELTETRKIMITEEEPAALTEGEAEVENVEVEDSISDEEGKERPKDEEKEAVSAVEQEGFVDDDDVMEL